MHFLPKNTGVSTCVLVSMKSSPLYSGNSVKLVRPHVFYFTKKGLSRSSVNIQFHGIGISYVHIYIYIYIYTRTRKHLFVSVTCQFFSFLFNAPRQLVSNKYPFIDRKVPGGCIRIYIFRPIHGICVCSCLPLMMIIYRVQFNVPLV